MSPSEGRNIHFDSFRHLVDCAAELTQLISAPRIYAGREVAVSEALNRFLARFALNFLKYLINEQPVSHLII